MKDTKQQFEHVIAICRDLFAKKLHDYGAACACDAGEEAQHRHRRVRRRQAGGWPLRL